MKICKQTKNWMELKFERILNHQNQLYYRDGLDGVFGHFGGYFGRGIAVFQTGQFFSLEPFISFDSPVENKNFSK